MAVPTTRELNVKVIFVVTIVAVLLLIAIVYAAKAGFFFFENRQLERQYTEGAERTFAETGLRMDNLELAELKKEQREHLTRDGWRDITDTDGNKVGEAELLPIDQAMQAIAERY
ncbi:MAG: hypothetical protein AAGL98_02890 [Planctomycetota bacterium]